jgi:hypothetical protein
VVFDPGGDDDPVTPPPPPSTWASFTSTLLLLQTTLKLQPLMALGHDTFTMVSSILLEAQSVLGSDIVYDESLFTQLNLPDFTANDFAPNDAKLQTQSLDSIIAEGLRPHRAKGLQDPSLTEFLQEVSGGDTAQDLLHNGARSFMLPQFKVNGGRECSVGGSYLKYRPLCNDALLQLVRKERRWPSPKTP